MLLECYLIVTVATPASRAIWPLLSQPSPCLRLGLRMSRLRGFRWSCCQPRQGIAAAYAQITCQMVAEGLHIPTRRIRVTEEGDLDLRGTLGIDPDVPVGLQDLRMNFAIDAPGTAPVPSAQLKEKTKRYCVLLQSMLSPTITSKWSA